MIRTLEFIAFAGGLYASFRAWIWICDHVLLREQHPLATAPGLPDDGEPLSEDERGSCSRSRAAASARPKSPGSGRESPLLAGRELLPVSR